MVPGGTCVQKSYEMKKILLFMSLACALFSKAQGDQTIINVSISTSGTEKAVLHLPDDYVSTTTKYPILVFLHGSGESGSNPASIYNNSGAGGPAYFIARNTFPTSFTNPADGLPYKFIVLSPQDCCSGWSTSGRSLDYILRYMVTNYRIDTTRIYLTGLSAGGAGIVQYVSRTDDNGIPFTPRYKVPAYVPMSEANGNPSALSLANIVADSVKSWGFGDPVNDPHGYNTKLLEDGMNLIKPGIARFTSYSGGHCCWNTYYNPTYKATINGISMNIYEWMLQFKLGSSGATPTNVLPASNAGADISITLPVNSVTLNGSGSDADGTVSSYAWTKVSGGAATIVSASSASTSVTGLVQGTYTFRLTVTDNQGATATDDVVVTVNPAPNVAPVANAGPDQTITLPVNNVTLSGSATDADGTISSYSWSKVSGGANNSFSFIGFNFDNSTCAGCICI